MADRTSGTHSACRLKNGSVEVTSMARERCRAAQVGGQRRQDQFLVVCFAPAGLLSSSDSKVVILSQIIFMFYLFSSGEFFICALLAVFLLLKHPIPLSH